MTNLNSELSPFAPVFSPRFSPPKKKFDVLHALSLSSCFLSKFEFSLLSSIVNEWFSSPTLSVCTAHWKSSIPVGSLATYSNLNVLLFNVRGLKERWEETLLLFERYRADVLILTEIGAVDSELIQKVFVNMKYFVQKGENPWGGVLIALRSTFVCERIACDVPKVCVVEVQMDQKVRIVGVYAPRSRTWKWEALSRFVSSSCCVVGDFNIDLEDGRDEREAATMCEGMNALLLVPVRPSTATSR